MGRLVTMLYAVIALPLVSMFIINIGASVASVVRYVWARGCCYSCWKKRLISHNQWPAKRIRQKEAAKAAKEEAKLRAKSAASGTDVLLEDAEPVANAASLDPSNPNTDQSADPEAPDPEVREEEEEEDEEPEQPVPSSITLIIVVFYCFLGTITFSYWSSSDDKWSLVNSLYFR